MIDNFFKEREIIICNKLNARIQPIRCIQMYFRSMKNEKSAPVKCHKCKEGKKRLENLNGNYSFCKYCNIPIMKNDIHCMAKQCYIKYNWSKKENDMGITNTCLIIKLIELSPDYIDSAIISEITGLKKPSITAFLSSFYNSGGLDRLSLGKYKLLNLDILKSKYNCGDISENVVNELKQKIEKYKKSYKVIDASVKEECVIKDSIKEVKQNSNDMTKKEKEEYKETWINEPVNSENNSIVNIVKKQHKEFLEPKFEYEFNKENYCGICGNENKNVLLKITNYEDIKMYMCEKCSSILTNRFNQLKKISNYVNALAELGIEVYDSTGNSINL